MYVWQVLLKSNGGISQTYGWIIRAQIIQKFLIDKTKGNTNLKRKRRNIILSANREKSEKIFNKWERTSSNIRYSKSALKTHTIKIPTKERG